MGGSESAPSTPRNEVKTVTLIDNSGPSLFDSVLKTRSITRITASVPNSVHNGRTFVRSRDPVNIRFPNCGVNNGNMNCYGAVFESGTRVVTYHDDNTNAEYFYIWMEQSSDMEFMLSPTSNTDLFVNIEGGMINNAKLMLYRKNGRCVTNLSTVEIDPNELWYTECTNENGKWKYYLLAFGIPLFYMIITVFLVLLVYCRDAESWFATDQIPTRFWTYFSQIGTTLLLFMPLFGEEFGWRAYMTPKLEQIMPMPAALVVGGILWGVWHAPLTVQGHNFGLDYPGFPFLGILMMCIMCTAMGAILTLLTKRTQSVIPAAIMHCINNNMSFGVFLSMFGAEALSEHLETLNSPATMAIMIIPEAIIGAVCFVILCKESGKEAKTSA